MGALASVALKRDVQPMDAAQPVPMRDDGALVLENRRRLFEFIQNAPGSHLREVQRALGLPYGTAEYHLHALEDAGVVKAAVDGNLKRYFVADFSFADRELVGLLRKRPVRAVVLALLEAEEMTHHELARRAGIKPPTLSYHLPRLEAAHLVEVRRNGRSTIVRLSDPKQVTRLLIAHARSFADLAVDRFLRTWLLFHAAPREAEPPAPELPPMNAGSA